MQKRALTRLEYFGTMDFGLMRKQKLICSATNIMIHLEQKEGAFEENNTLPIIKHGGGSIVLKNCVAVNTTGNIMWVEEKMNSTKY